jgi:hypothetical protein
VLGCPRYQKCPKEIGDFSSHVSPLPSRQLKKEDFANRFTSFSRAPDPDSDATTLFTRFRIQGRCSPVAVARTWLLDRMNVAMAVAKSCSALLFFERLQIPESW